MKKILFFILVICLQLSVLAQTDSSLFIRGIDISTAQQIEDAGGVWKSIGSPEDVLDIFKTSGVNYVRLRLWHTPQGLYCGLDSTLKFAKQIKTKGFKFLLDIHYSDTWADPGHQSKPAAWNTLPFSVLEDSVYTYSKNVIAALKNQNTLPDMVQVGNEITNGMLWPDGENSGSSNAWTNFASLVKKGIQGVKDAAGSTSVKIMIHIDQGGNNSTCRWFFDSLITSQSVQFDVIGLSYYPWYPSHGTLSQLQSNLNDLSARYNKDIVIVETAYPWTSAYVDDGVNNVGFDSTKLPQNYPVSPQGQKNFILYIRGLIENTSNKKGTGFFYWEPAYISVPPVGSSWENYAMFDFDGNAFNSLQVFQNNDSIKTLNIEQIANTPAGLLKLYQNYPNPFNPSTVIRYSVTASQNSFRGETLVKLEIFDILGNKIATLVNEYQNPGEHSIIFNTQLLLTSRQIPSGVSSKGGFASGVYFYRIMAGGCVAIKKMILLR